MSGGPFGITDINTLFLYYEQDLFVIYSFDLTNLKKVRFLLEFCLNNIFPENLQFIINKCLPSSNLM